MILETDLDPAETIAEQRLRIALGAGRMGMWTFDLKTGLQEWDAQQRALLDVAADAVPSRELFLSLVLPEDRAAIDLTPSDLRPGAFQDSEFRIRRRDGSIRWLTSHSLTRVDRAGRPIELVGVNWDITDLKTEQFERLRAERRLELATAAAEIGIWHWDVVTGEFYYSPRAREIYGFGADETITYDRLRQRTNPEDYRYVEPAVQRALDPKLRQQEVYRYRITRADDGRERWILAHGGAEFSDAGAGAQAVSYTGTIQDITAEVQLEQRLRDEQARLSLALAAADLAVWELDLVNNRVTTSPELNRLYRFAETSTPSFEEFTALYAPGERERVEAEAAAMLASGDHAIRFEARHVWPDQTVKWISVRAQVVFGAENQPVRVIGVAMDVTARRQSEEHMAVVARELQHRVKNSLTVVQSIASQTFRTAKSKEEGLQIFSGRLRALGAATDLMTRGNWEYVLLGDVVDEIIRPYRDGSGRRFRVEGEPLRIASQQAVNLGMALHELCTNAVKYGALSNDIGTVTVAWTQSGGATVVSWSEADGPPVVTPHSTGFGTRLLQSGLFKEVGGAVTLEFAPGGVQCQIRLTASAEVAAG